MLLKLPEVNPIQHISGNVPDEEMFLMNEKGGLDIDDVNMDVLEEND